MLDLDAVVGFAGAVDGVCVASASIRALRRMPASERDELARAHLSPHEIDRYRALDEFSKRQLEWLGGRLAVKRSIAELVARSPREIEIRQEGQTRPYVQPAEIHVAISHSFDVALGAAAPYEIGIDVELVRPLPAELLEYAFAAGELEPLGMDDAAVVRLWTMKESFVKMLGLGIPAFDELQLVSSERERPAWRTRGRVAQELGARQPRCWAEITSGYAVALTWSETQ
ncbi:MAG TPA: 4'-phosphopantetheinyl transferase superfamily protein [Kofleriaceae bacterium]|nr:4'-phosphopantetheinyl transferase superfamily protein [Kofleriaceae bacterium]